MGGMGNGMEVTGREGWSLQVKACPHAGVSFPFQGCRVSYLASPCPACVCTRASFPNPPPRPSDNSAPCPRTISFLPYCHHLLQAAPDHPEDDIPKPGLAQLFLEIIPHQNSYFLMQIISFCLRASSLAFLNTTVRIDVVLAQHSAVNSSLLEDFSSLSNQEKPS